MRNCFVCKSATLLFLFFGSFAFAGDTTSVFDIVMSQLSFILGSLPFIIGNLVVFIMAKFTWHKIDDVLFRSSSSEHSVSSMGTFTSNSKTREEARKSLSSSKNKESRWIGESSARDSSSFRRKFSSYEDFQGSNESNFYRNGSSKSDLPKFKV